MKLPQLFSLSLIFLTALAAGLRGGSAGDFPGAASLYQAQAIVTGQGRESRQTGFGICLESVLVKVSGDQRLLQRPELSGLLDRAGEFIAGFSYRDRLAGMPIHDDQGTYDRPHDLFCTFDAGKIDAALAELGSRPWLSGRPTLVVLLAVENDERRLVLSADRSRWPEMHEAFSAAADALALRVVFPEQSVLADVLGPDVRHATPAQAEAIRKKTGGDVALVGRLRWSDEELGWVAEWRLHSPSPWSWSVRGVNFDKAFRVALRGAAQIFSGNGKP